MTNKLIRSGISTASSDAGREAGSLVAAMLATELAASVIFRHMNWNSLIAFLRSPKGRWAIGLTLAAYWAALAIGTHLPMAKLPDVPKNDKALHFLAYGGLAALISLVIWARKTRIRPLLVIGCVAGYGIIDELSQIPVGRSCEFLDWVADVAGAITGVLAVCGLRAMLKAILKGKSATEEADRTEAVEAGAEQTSA